MTPAELLARQSARAIEAGRRRHEPERDTQQYARMVNIGNMSQPLQRPLIKPTPANLRMFGKTTFARRAIKHIKDSIVSLPWSVVPKPGVTLNSEIERQIEISRICLAKPNHDDSFRSFTEAVVEDMLVNGGGVYEHQLGGDQGRPLWMWPVDTLSMQMNGKWDGSDSQPRYFQTLGYANIGGSRGIPLLDSEIVYARVDPTTEHPFGLGPLEVAFAAINRKLAVANYAGNLAGNAQPENLLVFEGMSAEQCETLRMYWRNEVEGQGQTPIQGMPAGAKAEVLKLRGTDDDALFLKYQELLIREIAAAFGISPMVLGIEKDVNRNTAEATDDRDWDSTIVPIATNYSAHVTSRSIERRLGFSQIQLEFQGLKREDKMAAAEIYQIEYESNAVTPNEYRERHNMPRDESEWGDMHYADVQIAVQAAKGAGEVDDPNLTKGSSKKSPSKSKRKGAKG